MFGDCSGGLSRLWTAAEGSPLLRGMDLHARYPGLSDLRAAARRRMPYFVWEYLDSATGAESTKTRNRAALDAVLLRPSILHGEITPDLSAQIMGRSYPLPFGVAPVGMSGLFWPGAEVSLARAATAAGLPYGLSTVASRTPEEIAPHLDGNGWFQLYPPRSPEIRADMLARIAAAGFTALVLTADVPCASRRERQVRSGLTSPPRLTPRLLAQVALKPAWALGTLKHGMPRMRLIDEYAEKVTGLGSTQHAGYQMRTSPDWDYLAALRDGWQGDLIVKGVLRAEDAPKLEAAGVDAIWVSNHAGRQFDGAAPAVDVLPAMRAATSLPLICDSGLEGGLDILRCFARGADFVMFGQAWHHALAALGQDGPAHMIDILRADLASNMGQLGARRLNDLPSLACDSTGAPLGKPSR